MTAHAIVALHRGELDAALERVEAMIRKWEGRPFYESRGVALRGRIRAARGDLEGARRDYLEALALQDRLGFEVAAARSRLGLAEVELAAGDLGRVDELVRAAMPPIARELLAPDLAQAAALAALSTHRRGGRASTAELHRLAAAVESWPLRQQILLGAAEIEGDAAAAQELRRRAAAAGFVRLGR